MTRKDIPHGLPPRPKPKAQRGAALIVALILLLIMTILGLASMRSTIMEERMSASLYDRSLAFQAAEAALRAGEAAALAQANQGNTAFPNSGRFDDHNEDVCTPSPCNTGLCATPDPNCPPRWEDETFAAWANAPQLDPLSGIPQYFVEFLTRDAPCNPENTQGPTPGNEQVIDPRCSQYRVTARSIPAAGRAQVILQSTYLAN